MEIWPRYHSDGLVSLQGVVRLVRMVDGEVGSKVKHRHEKIEIEIGSFKYV